MLTNASCRFWADEVSGGKPETMSECTHSRVWPEPGRKLLMLGCSLLDQAYITLELTEEAGALDGAD
jgi:hypothetical protein